MKRAALACQRRLITSPQFTQRLFEEAKNKRHRVVLPEGGDKRVVAAAVRAQEQGLADITLLGDRDEIMRAARELQISLGGVAVLDPAEEHEARDRYAAAMHDKRSAKGLTEERAAQLLRDDHPIFGTMMVALGDVDGMVSGACHTSADTIRPALQLVGSDGGVVSSLMFMLLDDNVMVYADCALQVSPKPEELASIAAASALTARCFGVDPRVAMLSFATGCSNDGPMVEHVRRAADIARELLQDQNVPVAGPLQYDAAVNYDVARKKGAATNGESSVLVFPDLNCGNITYKAVQQSTGCVVMGPVLQGLRRPVNDLSRGSTVDDIVTTVAVTANQCIYSSAMHA